MSDWRDYPSEMPPLREIDDATAEAVLRGDAVSAEFEPLVTALTALRATPELPVRPSTELAARMAAGDFASAVASPRSRRSAGRHSARHRGARRKLAALPVRVKVAAAAALATGGLATATAAGALPEPAQQRVQSVIESVTPINFPEPADFGRDVADDARHGGVDGGNVSDKARQLGTQPDEPSERQGPPAKAGRPAVPADPNPTDRPPKPAVPADPPRSKVSELTPAPPVGGPADTPGKPDRPGIPEPPDPEHDRPVAPRPAQ